jgi:hypothetical protein
MGARILCLVVAAAGLAACQGRVLPMSAQAGSSIVIPLTNTATTGAGGTIGYGGTLVDDLQRGELVFRLDSASGFELVTRGTTALSPVPASSMARDGSFAFAPPAQVFVMLDIPSNAPLGLHSFNVTRRRIENGVPVIYPGPSYAGQIAILPASLQVPVSGGGTQTVTGQPTAFERYLCLFGNCNWGDVSLDVPIVVPNPELQIGLTPAPWSIELAITYPAGVINVLEAYQTAWFTTPLNSRGLVWLDDSGTGTLHVSGVATNGTYALDRLSLAFELDGTAILDPSNVSVSIVKATDANGANVATTATVVGIY